MSVAVFVTVSVANSLIVRSSCVGNVGALFTSLTVTVKELVSLSGGTPLSCTLTVMRLMVGPWASVGVQVMTPLVEMLAPLGAVSRE